MKRISLIFTASALFFVVFSCNPNKAQNSRDQKGQMKQIPEEVSIILNRSCIGCHSENGRNLAKMKVNFTKWSEYTEEIKSEKGTKICEEVTGNKMPPKNFLEITPDANLSEKEKKIICSWTATLRPRI